MKINENGNENKDKGESNSSKNNIDNTDDSSRNENNSYNILSDDSLQTKKEREEEAEIGLEAANFDDYKYNNAYKVTQTENFSLLEGGGKQKKSKKSKR